MVYAKSIACPQVLATVASAFDMQWSGCLDEPFQSGIIRERTVLNAHLPLASASRAGLFHTRIRGGNE